MIGMLNIYHLHHDSQRIDCAMNSFRRQTRDQRHALCNCSNADIQSEKDQTLSQVVLDGNKLIWKMNNQIGQEVA